MRRALRMLLWTLAVAAALFLAFAAYVRLAPDDAQAWHMDPATAQSTGRPNEILVAPSGGDIASPVFEGLSAEGLMARLQRVALAEPRVTLLGERDGFATYVQRSALMRYPDYISAKAVEVEGGAALYLYSRSRYGYDDMGVNRARALRWLEKLEP